jgi:SAM-dependent methyltransferase
MSDQALRLCGWEAVALPAPRPMQEPDSPATFETAMAHRYSLMSDILHFSQFSRWRDARVLELGCGAGMDAVSFARAGAEYTGLDISRAALAKARHAFKWTGVNGGLLHTDAARLMAEVRRASFDLVYCFDALAGMADPEAVIREVRGAIRPDGEFRLMLPAKESWQDAMGEVPNGYSAVEARALLRANDFAAVSIQQDHIFRYDLGAFAEGKYVLLPWFAAMEPAMFRRLEQRFGSHLLIIARPS